MSTNNAFYGFDDEEEGNKNIFGYDIIFVHQYFIYYDVVIRFSFYYLFVFY